MQRLKSFALRDRDVRYRDDVLLAVSKPPGLPVHATVDPRRPHLLGAVQAWVEGQGGAYASLAHRLDVDTSGLVLFVLVPSIHAAVGALFAHNRIRKVYRAVLGAGARRLPNRWRMETFLARDKTARAHTRYASVRAGGKKAITDFEQVAVAADGRVLVEARPLTGRAHQIRVHCAERGWPIEGDRYYGGAPGARLLLHAGQLCFPHPVTQEPVRIVDPAPPAFALS